MKRAKVTFFMIAYNEEKWIQRAIRSVLEQTEPDVELYVRNNGSTDRTGEIVREMAARDGRVHLVENQVNWWKDTKRNVPFVNGNGAVDIWPINHGTLGDYVSFLDADDRVESTFVEELLSAAQRDEAEITVCGNVFMQDGVVPAGERLPPPLHLKKKEEWGAALRDFNTFVQLYNSFRTYWGKLFRRDFFLKHYDEAWQPIGSRYGAFLDTVTMLRYLQRCERLSCVPAALYLFTQSSAQSTYSNSSIDSSVGKAVLSEELFNAGFAFLNNINALTPRNQQFLYQLNWAFCWEAMESLQRAAKTAPADVGRIITPLNNRIASVYAGQSKETIWESIEPMLQTVWHGCGQKLELYLRYPIRLMYAKKLFGACPNSELLPVLILGVLCDLENQNHLGIELLQPVAEHFYGLEKSVKRRMRMDWTMRHSSLQNWWIEEAQRFDNEDGMADTLARQLREAFEQNALEDAADLLSKLGKRSPLHRDGVFFRIQLAELIGEHELAVVLAASARVLFGLDIEMQSLCWFILSQGEKPQ